MKVFIVSRNDCADLDIEGVFDTRDAACKFMVQQGGSGVVIEREMAIEPTMTAGIGDGEVRTCAGSYCQIMSEDEIFSRASGRGWPQ